MKHFCRLFLVSVVGAISLTAQTQPRLPAVLDSLVVAGTDLIMRQEYDSAFQYFERVSQAYPNSPEGYLFQAATFQARAMDFRDFRENSQFDSLLAISQTISEEMIEREPDSPWGHYYLGTTLGMDSYEMIQRGDHIGGYFKGRAAVSEIEETLELDSSFYDCYSILGTYYYWKSRKTEFLNWLPFFSDDREKGIQFLRIAVEKGHYQRYPALSNLMWVYLDARKFPEAETSARIGLGAYPKQRAFLHALASALMGQSKFVEAKAAYEHQLAEILAAPSENDYNEIGARLNIVFMQRALRDTSQVQEHLSVIFQKAQQSFPKYLEDKVEQHIQLARKFQQEFHNGRFSSQ